MKSLLKKNIYIRKGGDYNFPVILSFPHSGRNYKKDFCESFNIDLIDLRKSEDAFVDCLFKDIIQKKHNYIFADFPRTFIDLNRRRNEINLADLTSFPETFETIETQLALCGFGVIHTKSNSGKDIYKGKISWNDYNKRISSFYDPWYASLYDIIEESKEKFSEIILVDCHSMPSKGIDENDMNQCDFVIGDLNGKTCSSEIKSFLKSYFKNSEYKITFNTPFSGQNILREFANVPEGINGIQLEINKKLYMNENTIMMNNDTKKLEHFLSKFINDLGNYLLGLNNFINAAE
tara:strand:- start:258 stop:1133 length:876 start_codon:yes stop_codon:yes gene_type:complete